MQPITLTTQSISKPAGITPGNWHISLMRNSDNTVTHNYAGPLPETTFVDVPNGGYTISAERLDTTGATIGTAATRQFTVSDAETVDVPVAILVGGV